MNLNTILVALLISLSWITAPILQDEVQLNRCVSANNPDDNPEDRIWVCVQCIDSMNGSMQFYSAEEDESESMEYTDLVLRM